MNDSSIRALLTTELNSALQKVEEEVRDDKEVHVIISFWVLHQFTVVAFKYGTKDW